MICTKHTLKNGLRLLLIPLRETQTVTIQILAEAGSKYETKANNGISHFLEHMMFKGTKNRPNSKIITEQLDGVGGDYNAFTGKEETGYWVKVAAQHFDLALDVVSDLYLNSLLDQTEIEKERGVILQEAAMYRDTPMRYVWDVYEELMYGDQPAGWDIVGTEPNIKRFQRKDFQDYLHRMYLPQSTVVVIAGNVDAQKAKQQVEKLFGHRRSKRTKAEKAKTYQAQKKPALKLYVKETDQTHMILGVRSCDMYHPDRYGTVVLGTILGGGMSSRMFHNIREKHGLTYYIDAASEQMTDTGYLYARAGVQHQNLEKAVTLILKEFKTITDKPVPPKELRKAKEYLKGKTLMSLESTSAVASYFGDQELYHKPIRTPEQILAAIEKVSARDVQRIAKNIFTRKSLNLAYIGPHDNEERMAKLLTI